mgnify:CR=1 FL=1
MGDNELPGRDDKYVSRAVSSALEILDLLREQRAPLGVSQIARKAGISKTSTFRFLYTMERTGHVIKDNSGKYLLSGPGNDVSSGPAPSRIRDAALPHMRQLRGRFNETVSLGVLFRTHVEVVAVLESPQLIRMSNREGAILPPMGKAITAFQEESSQYRLINSFGLLRMTARTLTDETRVREEYAQIQKQGWSQDNRESAIEGHCFGAPVRYHGKVLAAISISFPLSRVPEGAERREMINDLVQAAKSISADLEAGQ